MTCLAVFWQFLHKYFTNVQADGVRDKKSNILDISLEYIRKEQLFNNIAKELTINSLI